MPPPSPKKSRKRRRSGPGTPPDSLLQLLRDDAAVLEFFQDLQASLEQDVQIQKDRAQAALEENGRLRAEVKRLKKKAKQQQQPASKKNGAAARKPPKKTASEANTTKKASTTKKDGDDDEDEERDTKKPAAEVVQKERPTLAQLQADSAPIVDDSFFDLSDEDDLSSLSADEAIMEVSESTKLGQDAENSAAVQGKEQNEMKEDRKEMFCFLKEAHDILTSLRISTVLREEPTVSAVEEEKKEDTSGEAADKKKDDMDDHSENFGFGSVADEKKHDNEADDNHNKPASAPVQRIMGRKSDERMLTEILDRIKNNSLYPRATSKCELLDYASNEVFTLVAPNNEELVPTCNPSSSTGADHPLLRGKRLLLRCLILLDTFCSPSVSTSEWDSLFDETILDTVPFDTVKAIQLGLRNRKVVVDRLLAYWDGSVSERWAWYDRSLRLTAQYVKYVPSEQDTANPAIDLKGDGTNNCSWLWTLPGRAVFAQCTTFLHLLRQEYDTAARNVIEYILSTSPALSMEDHPTLPPVMSFVTLESLLLLPDTELYESYLDIAASVDISFWFRNQITNTCSTQKDGQCEVLLQSIALAVQCVASIWKQRLASWDEKIHDVAGVELAAHKRLLESQEWLRNKQQPPVEEPLQDTMDLREMVRLHTNDLLQISAEAAVTGIDSETNKGGMLYYNYALQIALVLHGDRRALQTVVNDGILRIDDESRTLAQNTMLRHSLVNLSHVGRHLALRELDTYRRQIGVLNNNAAPVMDMSGLFKLFWEKRRNVSRVHFLALLCTFLQCSVVLADGSTALRVTQELVKLQGDFENLAQLIYERVRHAGEIPQVRVINLKRRSDRMKAFMSQAAREQLLVVKAVATFEDRVDYFTENETPSKECDEFGDYAIDGIGRLVEANKNLVDRLGSVDRLDKVVLTHWRPNDLKAFDKDALDSEHLVRMTPTERACALSHVASWKGAARSMTIASTLTEASALEASVSKLFGHPQHTLRLLKIGGFAQGPALLPKNNMMPPAPVCVILEDDAVLEDRFAEKLADVLKELPRDFHFCSIGYSRPKLAPIVPFGDTIGIPTMLWYLTGYCISEAGANYLLDSLPVVGPVDSWIGLKMTRNWDNIFGCRLGVGAHANPNVGELPARKDLRKILDFRAFCSLHPLCSQKIKVDAAVASAGTVVAASTARSWRQRDTDIVYSGSAMAAAELTTTTQR